MQRRFAQGEEERMISTFQYHVSGLKYLVYMQMLTNTLLHTHTQTNTHTPMQKPYA